MSERTFRAVVATVLVGALALALVVVIALLPRSSEPPRPSPSTTSSAAASPQASATSTPVAGPVFAAPEVVSVGLIPRGATSGMTLVLRFPELSADAIPDAPGSFLVALADQAGDGSTVAFSGTPSLNTPGSLGATVSLVAPNVLMVSIVASDTVNVEPITISGLGIKVSPTAAIGPLKAELNAFTGSLASGAAGNVLASPGSVAASP